ncbi:MAG TPA: class I SAM-dependent methyltransferase [Candidatus Acidoferrum sp.]|nr:class I SAM-dependent methyltransferase [Candidatus Acidoferrum sp.]
MKLIAEMLPFAIENEIAVLDMCCGPGDLGRFVRERFPRARIDCVDRDPFLLALCTALNRRKGIPGDTFVRDMWNTNWSAEISGDYDAIVASTALHWFDERRLGELFVDVFGLLKRGGVFLFAEPACAQEPFATAFSEWKAKQAEAYDPATWDHFWARANALLGYEHREVLGCRPAGRDEIGDRGIPVPEYVGLLEKAGFEAIDILLRDAEKVVLASLKP